MSMSSCMRITPVMLRLQTRRTYNASVVYTGLVNCPPPCSSTTPSSLPTLHCIIHPQIHSPLHTTPFSFPATRPIPLHATPPIVQIILPGFNILIYPLRHLQKCPLYPFSTLCTCLDILHHTFPLTPLLRLLLRHRTLITALCVRALDRKVGLIPYQNDDDAFLSDLLQVMQP